MSLCVYFRKRRLSSNKSKRSSQFSAFVPQGEIDLLQAWVRSPIPLSTVTKDGRHHR